MSSDHKTPQHADTALIIGCGYLGKRLAGRLIARGQVVYGTTRGEARAQSLAESGIRPLLLSVTQPVTYASLTPALSAEALDVYLMVPPGRVNGSPSARHVVLGGTAHVLKTLRRANARRAVMVSSSAVYGQADGRLVDADSPPDAQSERAGLLLGGEGLWLDAGPEYSVVRLAGLYGPGRVTGMRALREGSPLLGNPDAMLNLIHVDDAVDLLLAMTGGTTCGRVELGCDGHPVKRIDYYKHLANILGLPGPEVIDNQTAATLLGVDADRLARSSNRALDNTVTCKRTGWSVAVPDYRAGLEAILSPTPKTQRQTLGRTC